MGLFDRAKPTEALKELYERERAAILSGRFDVLERLVAEKERLVMSVVQADRDDPALHRLKQQAQRNGTLLRAMESGVRAAARRIEEMRTGSAALQTYDSAGQKQAMPTQSGLLHRRA